MKTELTKEDKQRAGHQEIQGETIAKFEFFEQGYNPYSRYLDVDKVDLVLRKRQGTVVEYKEVQVKYGRLYDTGPVWQKKLFDMTSWRMLKPEEFASAHSNLFIAYVLAHPNGYKGDIFIFPAKTFHQLVKSCIQGKSKQGDYAKMLISRAVNTDRWFIWRKTRFEVVDKDSAIEVTQYRRNFELSN
ncbi:MAG: hypothetical protein AABY53_01060 [Bdellovibrionota bacterium]